MQPFPSQPSHYLPLALLPFIASIVTVPHCLLLSLLILLRPHTTQNYCNAAASLFLSILLLLLNLQ